MIRRKKQLIITAHCVLNQNTVIRDWERAEGGFNELIKIILSENLGIVQLQCPEFAFSGEARPPRTKQEYDTPEFRNLCKNLLEPTVEQLKEYHSKGYFFVGMIGISKSPSCDIQRNRGVFMEVLLSMLSRNNIHLETFDIPEDYHEGNSRDVCSAFRQFINNQKGRTE
ncbi:Predicted secreted protein [Tindallia magadiensis]|uniref:Predicted secreted protein n=1 Tax=Tindallia magadiensis TaxID=69895 RepID=A0A1I3G5S3_9FIRM|nr:CD3072 family TudS-related putative desulfidase [Tindallia magadiensis]SFI18784.1 Predicted secreted protein [Tindallia magadiensis]